MKIFNEINKQINNFVQTSMEQDIYLGHYPLEEMDEEDKIELGVWSPLGKTLYEKKIGNKTFAFDLIIPEE